VVRCDVSGSLVLIGLRSSRKRARDEAAADERETKRQRKAQAAFDRAQRNELFRVKPLLPIDAWSKHRRIALQTADPAAYPPTPAGNRLLANRIVAEFAAMMTQHADLTRAVKEIRYDSMIV